MSMKTGSHAFSLGWNLRRAHSFYHQSLTLTRSIKASELEDMQQFHKEILLNFTDDSGQLSLKLYSDLYKSYVDLVREKMWYFSEHRREIKVGPYFLILSSIFLALYASTLTKCFKRRQKRRCFRLLVDPLQQVTQNFIESLLFTWLKIGFCYVLKITF